MASKHHGIGGTKTTSLRQRDLESSGSHYNIPIEKLKSIFDPKSIRNFIQLGGLETLASDLNTDVQSGLPIDNNDSSLRCSIYGRNKLPPKNQKSLLKLCWEALHDQVLVILCISAVVSLLLGLYETFYQPPEFDDDGKPLPKIEWVDGCAILLAVLIVVVVGALNDYNKEKQFMKLNNKKEDRQIIVYRSNEKIYISIYDLLVGDLLYIETGDVIPADSILISGECTCDESSITGESKTIEKKTIYQSLSYYNDEVRTINSNVNSHSNLSSSSSLQFDIGDADVLDPILISGSKLLSGQGKALVVCVGKNSVNGSIMSSLSNDDDEEVTPLQNRLDILANGISKYGILAAIVLFIILFVKFVYQLSTTLLDLTTAQKLSRFINIIITSITIVVVAIPEGLPLAVTLALAFATTRMTEDGNLVRVLKSCETMGGATTICSDKTGTLTINKMSVVQGLVGDDQMFNDNLSSSSPSPSTTIFTHSSNKLINNLFNNIILNSTAFENSDPANIHSSMGSEISNNHIGANIKGRSVWDILRFKKNNYNHILPLSSDANETSQTTKDDFMGSKTECALLSFAKNKVPQFMDMVANIHRYRVANESNIVKIIPFESSLKWSGVVYHNKSDNSYTFYIKGAAEIILNNCDSLMDSNGEITKFTDSHIAKLNKIRESLASQALRAVSLAHHAFDQSEVQNIDWDSVSAEDLFNYPLTLDLMVGLQDPLRPGVRKAIEQCHRAGVDVKMVTGDNVLTARAISKGCGILTDETFDNPDYFMEGPQFRSLSESERLRVVSKLHILARSSPEDKRILVQTLKKLGEVVAVTGDGTNDAPALKLADVGFSMGISGTEVAREASDIVLMSDDFTSIVNAIKWGRTVAASIRKFVQFQLTVNFTAVILTFVTAIGSKEDSSVLTAVQLLWINLIMDTLAALALATDKPDDDVLDSKPEGRNNNMISANMWKMIIGLSAIQLTITLVLNFHGGYFFFGKSEMELKSFEKMMLKSMTFNTFVWMQVFSMFVSRILNDPSSLNSNSSLKERFSRENIGFFSNLTRNYWFIGITGLISILQILIMFYGGPAFSAAPQTISMWLTALVCGYSMIPFGVLLRVIPDEFFLKHLPINGICKCIGLFEWFMFGCGSCYNAGQGEAYGNLNDGNNIADNYDDNNNNDNNNNTNYNNSNTAVADLGKDSRHEPNPLRLSCDTSTPDIILSASPSPLLDSKYTGENHKLTKLDSINTKSRNTSDLSLSNSKKNRLYLRSRSPSQEHLFDGSQDNVSYTETEVSLKASK